MMVGIDCGITGALAVIDNGEILEVYDMPTRTVEVSNKTKQEINGYELARIIRSIPYGANINLEKVAAMSKQGVTSMFGFGASFGMIRGVLESLGKSYSLITPQVWKKHFGLIGTEKDVARLKAIELFPMASLYFKRKRDGGRADAALIGLYEKCQIVKG